MRTSLFLLLCLFFFLQRWNAKRLDPPSTRNQARPRRYATKPSPVFQRCSRTTISSEISSHFPPTCCRWGQQDLDFGQFFSKTGLIVRADSAFEILVPEGSNTRVHWGWRDEPVRRFIVPACQSTDAWVGFPFAGGFWVDEATCVELIVRRPDQEDTTSRASASALPLNSIRRHTGVC